MLLAGVALDRAVARPVRRRAPALLAGPAAARRPRPARPRRAHQPPRRRGGRLAGPAPASAAYVARSWWSPTTAGSSTRSATTTWEVHDGVVDAYEGGYAAYVLAKAERQRQAAASEARRQNLVRKELAWLRRGAAGAHLEAEVPDRRGQRADRGRAAAARPARAAAVRHPAARQGRRRRRGRRPGPRRADAAVARHLAARARRPGRARRRQRAGKTTVLRLLAGDLAPTPAGSSRAGRSRCEHLTQALDELDPSARVLRLGRADPRGSPGPRRARSPRPRCWSGSASPATG